jgi:predicted component of type VI protein secretion system
MRLSLHDALSQARRAIENFIEAYEPRMSDVRVMSRPRDHDQLGWLSASKASWRWTESSARSVLPRAWMAAGKSESVKETSDVAPPIA